MSGISSTVVQRPSKKLGFGLFEVYKTTISFDDPNLIEPIHIGDVKVDDLILLGVSNPEAWDGNVPTLAAGYFTDVTNALVVMDLNSSVDGDTSFENHKTLAQEFSGATSILITQSGKYFASVLDSSELPDRVSPESTVGTVTIYLFILR